MNKEDKQGLIIFGVLMFIACIIFCIVINTVRANNITYEYFKDNEVGKSKECYLSKDEKCYCLIENNFIAVDGYYRIK